MRSVSAAEAAILRNELPDAPWYSIDSSHPASDHPAYDRLVARGLLRRFDHPEDPGEYWVFETTPLGRLALAAHVAVAWSFDP